jgi:hypothetical protein
MASPRPKSLMAPLRIFVIGRWRLGEKILPVGGHVMLQRYLSRAWIRNDILSERNPLLDGRFEPLFVACNFALGHGKPETMLPERFQTLTLTK